MSTLTQGELFENFFPQMEDNLYVDQDCFMIDKMVHLRLQQTIKHTNSRTECEEEVLKILQMRAMPARENYTEFKQIFDGVEPPVNYSEW